MSSITPDYLSLQSSALPKLTQDQQLDVVTELMGYHPRRILWEIVRPRLSPSTQPSFSVDAYPVGKVGFLLNDNDDDSTRPRTQKSFPFWIP